MSKVAILCRLVAKEGRRPELVDGLLSVLSVVRDEAGTEVYVVQESTSDDVTVFVYELYEDEAAYQVHRSSQTHARHVGRLDDLLVAPPELSFARPVGAKISSLSLP